VAAACKRVGGMGSIVGVMRVPRRTRRNTRRECMDAVGGMTSSPGGVVTGSRDAWRIIRASAHVRPRRITNDPRPVRLQVVPGSDVL
jgi:hypothetical protein